MREKKKALSEDNFQFVFKEKVIGKQKFFLLIAQKRRITYVTCDNESIIINVYEES